MRVRAHHIANGPDLAGDSSAEFGSAVVKMRKNGFCHRKNHLCKTNFVLPQKTYYVFLHNLFVFRNDQSSVRADRETFVRALFETEQARNIFWSRRSVLRTVESAILLQLFDLAPEVFATHSHLAVIERALTELAALLRPLARLRQTCRSACKTTRACLRTGNSFLSPSIFIRLQRKLAEEFIAYLPAVLRLCSATTLGHKQFFKNICFC